MICRMMNSEPTPVCGWVVFNETIVYVSPFLYKQRERERKGDIYSFPHETWSKMAGIVSSGE